MIGTQTYETERIRITIEKDDFILQEILSRTVKKNEFVKEAILYWHYILKHSDLRTRFIAMRDDEKIIIDGLFPNSYYSNRCVPDISLAKEYKESIPIRFDITSEEIALQKILKQVVSRKDYIKEAIFEWDCLLNHSNIFISRFINLKEDSVREWPILNGKKHILNTDQTQNTYNQKIDTTKNNQDSQDNKDNTNGSGVSHSQEQNAETKESSTEIENNKETLEKLDTPNAASKQTRRGRKNSLEW